METNFLLKNIKKRNIEKQVLESMLYKTIIDFFKQKKDIDFSKYIISVKIIERKLIIKTYRGFINYEILNYKKEILDIFLEKISFLGYKKDNFDLFIK